jgi:hypothetical protein
MLIGSDEEEYNSTDLILALGVSHANLQDKPRLIFLDCSLDPTSAAARRECVLPASC